MPTNRPSTRTEIMNFNQMCDVLAQLEWDLHQPFMHGDALPAAWVDIAAEPKRSKKKRITLAVEEDVLKFFRALGHPYQPRMNEVLRAFMHTKLAGMIKRMEELEELTFERAKKERPQFGHFESMRAEIRSWRDEEGA